MTQAYLVLAPGFVPAPRLTGISASSGPATGGTSMTITGTGFTGVTAVRFGSTAAQELYGQQQHSGDGGIARRARPARST